jgi:hypothetical protein
MEGTDIFELYSSLGWRRISSIGDAKNGSSIDERSG